MNTSTYITPVNPELSSLTQLKAHTTVVADTSDFALMRRFSPQDATTNPSLVLKAAQKPEYSNLVQRVLTRQHRFMNSNDIGHVVDSLLIALGLEILEIVPGRVSTEVDARLSFDTKATVSKAHQLINAYQSEGVDSSRVLIKIASTWEGIQAAKQLEAEGIHCNMTLLFSQVQAIACANAKVQLISPFVGRILDWHKKHTTETYTAKNDPGVLSVQSIYQYYKEHGIKTEIMGASFRNIEEIIALAGCDLLTISPDLLKALAETDLPINTETSPLLAFKKDLKTTNSAYHATKLYTESSFRFALNDDPMTTDKLAEGIRLFAADTLKLEQWLLSL